MEKSLFFIFLSLIFTIFAGTTSGDLLNTSPEITYSGDSAPRHVRIIWTENPAEHAIVSWTTMAPTSENTIYYDTQSRSEKSEDYRFSTTSERNGKITMRPMDVPEGVPPSWYHNGQLHDLEPSARYYFVVESEGKVTDEYYFKTAPAGDTFFKLMSGGNSRMGGKKPRYAERTPNVDRQTMNRVMVRLLEENPNILALTHGTDWVTTADRWHLYWLFEGNELVKTSDNRLLPFIVAMSNHDEEIGFLENFWLGDITDQLSSGYYYSTRIGSATLLTLNSEVSVASDQREWLEEELEELTSGWDAPHWLMALYHWPAYSVAKEFTRHEFTCVRQNWTPIFDRLNLDLALESDGHVLKRTVPIRNFESADDGVAYIGVGGLGVPYRTPTEGSGWIPIPNSGRLDLLLGIFNLPVTVGELQFRRCPGYHWVVAAWSASAGYVFEV